jgi:hypothetical protein
MPETRPDLREYDEPMTRKIIHLPPHLIEHAEDVGGGVLAKGVRECIERDMDDE